MKIVLIGASGNAGSHILEELTNRNYCVTSIVRDSSKIPEGYTVIERDLFDLTKYDLEEFDVVIDAFNAPAGKESLHGDSIAHLIELLNETEKRLLVVGGASSLFLDDTKTKRYIDNVPTDAPFYPTAHEMFLSLQELIASNIKWTYISPAAFFDPNGVRTGHYELFDDVMHLNKEGKSYISMADYAIALVDDLDNVDHIRNHISVVGERK
jgi:putative NADH-flavin reductase